MLRRWLTYLEKHYRFRQLAEGIGDTRKRPRIAAVTVFLSTFGMFAFRLGSLNALEQELGRRGRWERWVGKNKPSADTVGRVLAGLKREDLRRMLAEVNQRSWRSKGIRRAPGASYRVVAIDGHELFSSTARCCPRCSQRTVKQGSGEVVQYYHQVVFAQWAGVTPPAVLDVEMIEPGEGETIAAQRLVQRLVQTYGRLIDVITADALYLGAPFLNVVLDAGKHFVVVLKQENRELYQDANRLRSLIPATTGRAGDTTTNLWDLPGLTSFPTLGKKVRVVWSEETTVKTKRRGGKPVPETKQSTWIWVTDLPPTAVPAATIRHWGHDRWDVENRAFNELCTHWHLDHCFKHEPNAITAVLLILALAFLLTYLFYERNLNFAVRRQFTRSELAQRLREDLALLDRSFSGARLKPG